MSQQVHTAQSDSPLQNDSKKKDLAHSEETPELKPMKVSIKKQNSDRQANCSPVSEWQDGAFTEPARNRSASSDQESKEVNEPLEIQLVIGGGVGAVVVLYFAQLFVLSDDENKWMHTMVLVVLVAYCIVNIKSFLQNQKDLDRKIAEQRRLMVDERQRKKDLKEISTNMQQEESQRNKNQKLNKKNQVKEYKDNFIPTNLNINLDKVLETIGDQDQKVMNSKDKEELAVQELARQVSVVEDEFGGRIRKQDAVSITRIVVTGGPCAGKTTAIASISQTLMQRGYRVLHVPEIATILMQGNALSNSTIQELSQKDAVLFSINLINLQMAFEKIFVEIAETSDVPVVIIHDRGVMCAKSHCSENVWQAILDETGWSNVQLRDRRYEAIIHLMTAAEGAQEFFTCENEANKDAELKVAREENENLINCWVGHPQFAIIKNKKEGFARKIDYCLNKVLQIVGEPAPSGYVRKFLLVSDKSNYDLDLDSIKKEHFEVEETFLWKTVGESNFLQKIGKNDAFTYCHGMRYEIAGEKVQRKRQITGREYIELCEQKDVEKITIKKLRQCFIYERQYYTVETFLNIDPFPSILRVELSKETSKMKVPPYFKIQKEVTNDKEYETWYMADKTYQMPETDQIQIQQQLRAARQLEDDNYQKQIQVSMQNSEYKDSSPKKDPEHKDLQQQ